MWELPPPISVALPSPCAVPVDWGGTGHFLHMSPVSLTDPAGVSGVCTPQSRAGGRLHFWLWWRDSLWPVVTTGTQRAYAGARHRAQSSKYVCWVPRQCQAGSWAGLVCGKTQEACRSAWLRLGASAGPGGCSPAPGAYPTVGTLSVFVAGAGFPAQRRCEAVVGRGREAQAKRPRGELCPSGLVPGGAFTLASSLGLSCGPRVPTGLFQPLAVCWLPGSPSSSTRCWAPTHLTPGG